MDQFFLLDFFKRLKSGAPVSRCEMNCFIEKTVSISIACLKANKSKIYHHLISDSLTIEDLAVDAVSIFFEKNDRGEFYVLINAFNKWKEKIDSEKDAEYFISKITINRTLQHLIKYIKEKDPVFSKILDSINYRIKKNNFFKEAYCGTVYIVKEEIKNSNFIDEASFNRIPAGVFNNTDKLIDNLFEELSNLSFSPAIPLNLLIIRIKALNISSFSAEYQSLAYPENLELKEIIEAAIAVSFGKLENSYLCTNKLSREECEKLKNVLHDLAYDLQEGGTNKGLYDYLTPYFEISYEAYKKRYQNIVEYLFKVMKNNLAGGLSSLFSE